MEVTQEEVRRVFVAWLDARGCYRGKGRAPGLSRTRRLIITVALSYVSAEILVEAARARPRSNGTIDEQLAHALGGNRAGNHRDR